MKAPEQSQTKSQTRCTSPDYGDFCAPWARRRFGLPGYGERHLGRCHLARLASGRGTDPAEGHRADQDRGPGQAQEAPGRSGRGLKTSASYTVAKAVDDWAAEALDGLAAKTVRSHVDLLRPVTMLIGQIPLRDLTAHDVRRT